MFCKEAIEALELMKDQWRLSLTDAILDDINFLIMELKFLDIFLRLQSFTTDSNLLDVSEHVRAMVSVVGSDLKSLFSAGMVSPDPKFDLTLSEVQEKIRICKSEIKAQYSYPQVVNLSDATPISVTELILDVIGTIEYVVSTPLTSSLSISPQLQEQLFYALGSPHHICFMLATREVQDSIQMNFLTHAIAVTCHAAMIVFLHFPEHNKVNQETDINSLLADFILKRIFPIQPCVRRIYVELLQSFMSGPQFTWRHSVLVKMEQILSLFLKINVLMLRFSYSYGLIVPLEDQNQMDYFFEMLDYLGTYLEDLPPEGFGSKLTEIDNLMVNAALFIFSLYGNEEDVASGEVNQEAVLDLPGLIQCISALTYQIVQMSFQSILPRVDGLGFVDFLLVNMKEFLNQSADTLPSAKSQLEAVLKDLEFLHPFLRDVAAEKCINHDRLQHLATMVIAKAYEIEYIVDCFVTKDVPGWFLTPWLSDLIVEIEFLKAEVEKIKEDKACDAPMENFTNASNVATSSQLAKNGDHVNFSEEAVKEIADEVVGFDDVLQTLRDQLVRVTPRELDVISIVGISGQGKTTVANKLFTDELVVSLFNVRAKCFVPAAFQRRELLVAILRNLVDKTIDLSEAREDELAYELHRLLLPKRYLLLIDNVNDSVAWDYLRSCFPDANNGSRILLTTRLDEVATKARRVSSPHYLRLFTEEESWTLLQNKAFPRQSCPPNFRPLAEQLANLCGTPVRVVAVAFVLANMPTKELELLAKMDIDVLMLFIDEAEKKFREAMLDQARGSRPKSFRKASQGHISSQLDCTIAEDIVGFQDVLRTIKNLLVRGTSQRDVISIVGMAGQGKTTIANKLFIDESVVPQFDVRAKCYVSQVYNRREVLVSILSDVVDKPTDLSEVPEDELAVKLRKLLLSKRYLILIDDIWETRAWDELQMCFPDTNNSSRIMLTTRLDKVATYASGVSSLHHLRLFSEDESWTLLQKKVFLQQSCPPELEGVGQEIANKCGRLPLSIVLVAGVLASMTKKEQWEQVADGLGSHIRGDSKHIIQFSYKNLPHYLKPCFLYFGAFLEDKEIQISKLMKLWTAEGLVVKQKERRLADIAEDYLEDLIRRNMVMATKNRYLGKVKACRIHDLLLEFCKEKAKEEKFLLWIYRDQDANSTEVLSRMLVQRRISIYSKQHNLVERSPSCSNVHSILFRKVGDDVIPSVDNQVSFAFHSFKCLRVLDLEFVTVDSFPTELSQLRYLALRTFEESIPSSIANLRNIETLMVKGLGSELSLPHSLCKMVKMRHLHLHDRASFNLQNLKVFLEDPSELDNLETFSTPAFSSGEDVEKVLSKTPNLRKLRCIFSGSWGYSEEQQKDCNQFPRLQHLTKLESLKVFCFHKPERSPCVFNFPSDLKKLTLCGFGLPWSEISAISTLPNLVILKLQSDAFCGDEWEVSDEQFSQLKVLKLENISFGCWSVSEDAFSNLEQLVLHSCDCLVGIPSEFGYFTSLQSIEVKSCQESVANSARNVEEIQVEDMQNNGFKLFIY